MYLGRLIVSPCEYLAFDPLCERINLSLLLAKETLKNRAGHTKRRVANSIVDLRRQQGQLRRLRTIKTELCYTCAQGRGEDEKFGECADFIISVTSRR